MTHESMAHDAGAAAASEEQRRSSRRRVVVVGAVLPIVLAAIAVGLMASWLPELPDPIAVHWSGAGPDGYGPAMPFILLPLMVVVPFSVFVVIACWRMASAGLPVANQKFLVVTSVWMSSLLGVGIAGSVGMQRGLDDASQTGGVGLWLLAGAGVGLVLGLAAWFVLPPADKTPPAGRSVPPVELAPSERVSWSRTVSMAPVALVLISVTVVVALGVSVVMLVNGNAGSGVATVTAVFVVLVAVGMTFWRVSADWRGLRVRSVVGWPRTTIPVGDIRAVEVVDVNPSGEFGGWGWRWAGQGRTGVIMRAGEAIEVTRSNGKRFVVTVDDAATAAGVLTALAAKHAAALR